MKNNYQILVVNKAKIFCTALWPTTPPNWSHHPIKLLVVAFSERNAFTSVKEEEEVNYGSLCRPSSKYWELQNKVPVKLYSDQLVFLFMPTKKMDRGAWKVYALFIYFTKVQLERGKKTLPQLCGRLSTSKLCRKRQVNFQMNRQHVFCNRPSYPLSTCLCAFYTFSRCSAAEMLLLFPGKVHSCPSSFQQLENDTQGPHFGLKSWSLYSLTNFIFRCTFTASYELQLIVLDLLASLYGNPYF